MKVDIGALVRAILYSVALLYLFLDLYFFKGPLSKKVQGANPQSVEAIAAETARGVAARVYYQPILLTQIDREVEKRLWRQGKKVTAFSPEELKNLRLGALNGIFEEHLLRVKVRFNSEQLTVDEAEVVAAVQRFRKKFANEQLLEGAIANQAWEGEAELIARVRAKIEQENYLASHVSTDITEEELQDYYQEHHSRFVLPERVRARQIFFAALDHPNGEDSQQGLSARRALADGGDFAALAKEFSNDSNSAAKGGDLGWMSRARLPEDFAEALFTLEKNRPQLIKTSLGVHLVEVTDEAPARQLSFEEVRDELEVALSNRRREEGLAYYLRVLRYRDRHKVEIFDEVLDRPWSLAAPEPTS